MTERSSVLTGYAPCVLVAESNPQVNELICRLLMQEGFDVKSVFDGAAAILAVTKHAFACALIDCRIPEIDGLETARVIQVGNPRLPIILMTTGPLQDLVLSVKDLTTYGMLGKPFRCTDLCTMVTHAIMVASAADVAHKVESGQAIA